MIFKYKHNSFNMSIKSTGKLVKRITDNSIKVLGCLKVKSYEIDGIKMCEKNNTIIGYLLYYYNS